MAQTDLTLNDKSLVRVRDGSTYLLQPDATGAWNAESPLGLDSPLGKEAMKLFQAQNVSITAQPGDSAYYANQAAKVPERVGSLIQPNFNATPIVMAQPVASNPVSQTSPYSGTPSSLNTGRIAVTLGNGQVVYYDKTGQAYNASGAPVSNTTISQSTAASAPPTYKAPASINSTNTQGTGTTSYSSPQTSNAGANYLTGAGVQSQADAAKKAVDDANAAKMGPQDTKISDLISQTLGLNDQEAGKSAYQQQQNDAQGVTEKTKTLTDLQANLQGILNEHAAAQLTAQQGQGVTTAIDNRQRDFETNQNAIKALGLNSLIAAANGNLTTAQALADKAVALKFGPIEAQIKANIDNINLIKNDPKTTAEEKARADAISVALDAQKAAVADAKTNATAVAKVANDYASQGATAVQLQAIGSAPNQLAALQIAAGFGLNTDPNKYQHISATANQEEGYFNPATGQFIAGSGGAPSGSSGTYQAGQLTQLLQSQGKPTDDASLSQLWSSLGGQGTYTNDTAHNSQIYAALGGVSTGGAASSSGSTSGNTSTGSVTQTTISTKQVTALKNALNSSKFAGAEADGKYVDPTLYLTNYQSFKDANNGDATAFLKAFPPATYINPTNTWLPPEIMKFVKGGGSTSSGGDLFDRL